jgi:hypothetical protein
LVSLAPGAWSGSGLPRLLGIAKNINRENEQVGLSKPSPFGSRSKKCIQRSFATLKFSIALPVLAHRSSQPRVCIVQGAVIVCKAEPFSAHAAALSSPLNLCPTSS